MFLPDRIPIAVPREITVGRFDAEKHHLWEKRGQSRVYSYPSVKSSVPEPARSCQFVLTVRPSGVRVDMVFCFVSFGLFCQA